MLLVCFDYIDSGVVDTIFVSNTIVAEAFDGDLKLSYEACTELEQQAEILISNNPYLLTRNLFEKRSMKIRKLNSDN